MLRAYGANDAVGKKMSSRCGENTKIATHRIWASQISRTEGVVMLWRVMADRLLVTVRSGTYRANVEETNILASRTVAITFS